MLEQEAEIFKEKKKKLTGITKESEQKYYHQLAAKIKEADELKEAIKLMHHNRSDTTIPTPPAYENLLDRIQKMEEPIKKKEVYEKMFMEKMKTDTKSKIENIFEKSLYSEASSASTEDLPEDK